MTEDKFNIPPGPWGIGPSKKGGTEINFGEVDILDTSRAQPSVVLSNGERIVIPPDINVINIKSIFELYPKPRPEDITFNGDFTGNPFVTTSEDDFLNKMLNALPKGYHLSKMLIKGNVIDGDEKWKLVKGAENGKFIKLGDYYIYEPIKKDK